MVQRQEYDEAMSILKARTVDAEVQRKRFDNMHKAHLNMTAALATVAEEKAGAEREVTRARAELASASRGAVLAARAANDRAAQVATLLAEVERLQGRPPPEREPVPFPDVAAGGVSGWADEAQVRLLPLLYPNPIQAWENHSAACVLLSQSHHLHCTLLRLCMCVRGK